MRTIAEWLLGGLSTGAPEVRFTGGYLDRVGRLLRDFRGGGHDDVLLADASQVERRRPKTTNASVLRDQLAPKIVFARFVHLNCYQITGL